MGLAQGRKEEASHLPCPRDEDEEEAELLFQRQAQLPDLGQRNEHNPEIQSDADATGSQTEPVEVDAMALRVILPPIPVVRDWRAL